MAESQEKTAGTGGTGTQTETINIRVAAAASGIKDVSAEKGKTLAEILKENGVGGDQKQVRVNGNEVDIHKYSPEDGDHVVVASRVRAA